MEIGLAPRPTNTTTAVGRGLAGHAMCITGIGCFASPGGGGAAPSGAAGKGHGGHPAVVRGGGGGLGIPMASPRICTAPRRRPALRPAFARKAELMSTWDAQPPARPPPGPPRVPRGRGMRVGLARTGHRGVSRLARHRYGPHGPAGRM